MHEFIFCLFLFMFNVKIMTRFDFSFFFVLSLSILGSPYSSLTQVRLEIVEQPKSVCPFVHVYMYIHSIDVS